MQYKMKKINPTGKVEFTPFELTLTFETEEEWSHFHNRAMSRIAKYLEEVDSHQFFGDFYTIGSYLYPFANNFIGNIENE